MDLTPNITFFYQLALFLVVLAVLNHFLFQPALRVIDKRKSATAGVKEEVTHLNQMTEQKIHEYEDKIYQAKLRGAALKDKLKKEGEEEGGKIIRKAREASDSMIIEMEAKLAKEESQAEIELKNALQELATQMAEKVMERKMS